MKQPPHESLPSPPREPLPAPPQTRRRFLATLGLATLTTAALGAPRAAHATLPAARASHAARRIGLQLYTVRDLLGRDFEGTLARVAEIGFQEVEFAGYFGHSPEQVRAALARSGLAAPSAHVPLESGDAWQATLDAARVMGHRYVVLAWIPPEQRRTLDDYRRLAARLNRAGAAATAAGLRLAYHNHDFELTPLGESVPYDLLLAETDAAHVAFEMDIYWVVKAGGDPLAYLARHPGRFPMVHAKDASAAPERRMMDVGSGTIDFRTILARGTAAGVRHVFVEHDEPAEPLASARASYEHLAALNH